MRKRSLKLFSSAAAAGVLLTTSSAFAHIDLLEPPARAHGTAASGDTDVDENTNQKTSPCGQVTNGRNPDRVTTYAPGQTITVRVAEETNHDSYIRVSLDLDGDDDFQVRQPAVVGGMIAPETQEIAEAAEEALDSEHLLRVLREDNTANNFVHEIDVTLPNETCDNCTLQVIQLMYNTPQIYYFQCADLVIAEGGADAGVGAGGSTNAGEAGAAGAGGTPGSGSGGTSSAGTGGAGPGAGGGAGVSAGAGGRASTGGTGTAGSAPVATDDDDDGGCTIATHAGEGSAGAGLLSLLALGLGLVARRRR
jgi:MYXO-CTERM domain-containing protein